MSPLLALNDPFQTSAVTVESRSAQVENVADALRSLHNEPMLCPRLGLSEG
jgi:hypothetical protein